MIHVRTGCSHLAVGVAILVCPGIAVAQEWDLGPIPDVVIECFVESEDAGSLAPDSSLDGSWLQVRRDRKLTGRSPLIGSITCPEVLWKYDLAPIRKTWFAIRPGAGSSEVTLPTSGYVGSLYDAEIDYEVFGKRFDLNGDGSEWGDQFNNGSRIGDLLDATAGYDRVSCRPETIGLSPGENDEVPCYLQSWINGAWGNPEWTSSPVSGMTSNGGYGANAIVGDFDADGELEVGIRGWYDITLLDLATGVGDPEQVGQFHDPDAPGQTSGRAYGWWGAFNLDGPDYPEHEIVILGDFEQFISVLGWVDGQLTELWDHQIEAGVNAPTAKHHTGVNPVADVDGDGNPEIVSSVFNENGDQRWHVVGRDGISGMVEFDLADRYLSGLGDLDGNGVAELFVTETNGPAIPEFGNIRILSYDGGPRTELWAKAGSGFENYDIPGFPDHVYSGATYQRRSFFFRDDWTTGTPVFITREKTDPDNDIRMRFYQSIQDQISEIASLVGPELKLLSLPSTAPNRGILVRAYADGPEEGPILLSELSGEIKFGFRVDSNDHALGAALLGGTVVGSLEPGARPTVITQGFGETLHALQVSRGLVPTELWTRPGRGMISTDGPPYESVTLADILGNDQLKVIAARKGANGLGVITTYDSLGDVLWETQIDTPGDLPPWNEGGITTWTAGHFRSDQFEDIVVSWRTGTMHSSRLRLLDGPSGVAQWTQDVGGWCVCVSCDVISTKWTGAGGMHMPTLDWDADGLDEMLNMFSGLFAIYDGDNGDVLFNRWTHPFCDLPIFSEPFLEHAMGVVTDFMGLGTEQILFGKNAATLAALDFNANVFWNTTPFYSGQNFLSLQGIANLDGIGGPEIVSVGHNDLGKEIQAFDASGQPRWQLAMPELCEIERFSHVATGDIDGDGRDEALFNDCNFLYAIGENGAGEGEILWRATFLDNRWNADLGEVVIADIDGSGRPQILINTATGYLYSLGSAGRFDDVGLDYWVFNFIETLARAGITAGCGNDNYCPEQSVSRAQMAVFLERGMNGSGFSPPAATGSVFLDVGATDFAASFIEQLALDGITAGCGNNNYCPDAEVTRAQMAIFLLRAKHGFAYSPPPATGVFGDVPPDYWAVQWIEQLAAENITAGCGGDNYCPDAPVSRDQMAVFLVRTFDL